MLCDRPFADSCGRSEGDRGELIELTGALEPGGKLTGEYAAAGLCEPMTFEQGTRCRGRLDHRPIRGELDEADAGGRDCLLEPVPVSGESGELP
jgi:hypothetical protein